MSCHICCKALWLHVCLKCSIEIQFLIVIIIICININLYSHIGTIVLQFVQYLQNIPCKYLHRYPSGWWLLSDTDVLTNQCFPSAHSPFRCPCARRRTRRSSSCEIKVSREENVTEVEASASEKSESGTVRHVDSGVVMDGEWGKTDDIVCLRPCCHSGGLPLVLTSQYQRANWSLFTLLQWSDSEWGPRETWV